MMNVSSKRRGKRSARCVWKRYMDPETSATSSSPGLVHPHCLQASWGMEHEAHSSVNVNPTECRFQRTLKEKASFSESVQQALFRCLGEHDPDSDLCEDDGSFAAHRHRLRSAVQGSQMAERRSLGQNAGKSDIWAGSIEDIAETIAEVRVSQLSAPQLVAHGLEGSLRWRIAYEPFWSDFFQRLQDVMEEVDLPEALKLVRVFATLRTVHRGCVDACVAKVRDADAEVLLGVKEGDLASAAEALAVMRETEALDVVLRVLASRVHRPPGTKQAPRVAD
ncbi:unnamed protein product [Symbiodinium sp. CCMP2592]|nr:unnamed protein product [Symbiodinium sp. CCMP2592]